MGHSRDLSSAFSPPIELRVPRVGALRWVLVLLHVSAALPALLLDLHWSLIFVWLAAVGASAWRSLRPHGVVRLRLGADGVWQLLLADRMLEAELVAWFAQTWLCVLRFRSEEGSHTLALTPSAGLAAEHRRLRALLRLGVRTKTLSSRP